MTPPPIAIYGATGHTGRLVAAELHARGHAMVLAGRDAAALDAMAAEFGASACHAPLDDPAALRALAGIAAVLVNCAGPYSATGAPVATAAAEAGCHYIDHAVEPHHVKWLFDTLQAPAQRSGATMIPSLSFYGGLGDLLAAAVARGVAGIDRVTAAYAVAGWRLTAGALETARQLFADTRRIGFTGGAQQVGWVEPRNAVFAFPPPIGPRAMIAPVPFPEALTVPRHVPAREVEAMLTARTFEEEGVFDGVHATAATRAGTDFTVAVQVIAEHGGRSGQLSGRDLWRAAALASVEGAVRLAEGDPPAKSGVLAPAEVFPAEPFLRDLERLGAFTLQL
ncbi:saccharopine dehydrogenase [Sphaerisporangium rufum]|uniref:Saccharopine dehydrogenase n=1 Tax=Sphaerisporangium rufum TaxID=1381558 RepID=A0A919V2Y9_9ACTN|nr:saccharopine dehydrogenase NADP-binding domain-containing protein [Sphaerisporangium rufum]GII75765.1 saccharopine dehydrogenase [Sphaerisporangium rufum]